MTYLEHIVVNIAYLSHDEAISSRKCLCHINSVIITGHCNYVAQALSTSRNKIQLSSFMTILNTLFIVIKRLNLYFSHFTFSQVNKHDCYEIYRKPF